MNNPLRESGYPLFFKLRKPERLPVGTPDSRHGQSVRVVARSLSAMQKEALVYNSLTGNIWRLASDEGAYLNGNDEAPCPLAFLTTGMVSSYMEEIQALAKQRSINIDRITLIQDNYYTMKGSALQGTMTGGAKDISLEAQIDADTSAADLQQLVLDAVSASPLNGLMRGQRESYFTLTHNGRQIDTANAAPLPGSPPGSNIEPFQMQAAEGDWSGLIRRNGMTPETEESVTRAGDSLQAEQDRLLHLRGICTLRDDGIKAIEQQLFNPHGSIFHFLCEEGSANGGMGRAPDAASYISAGIAFCYMTQLGRYAGILKKKLGDYAVIQDIHFSPGGASGKTGTAGTADPVETHVYIDSNENDDFARKILDMGEQTCFLHAFCRTDLRAKVRISGPGA